MYGKKGRRRHFIQDFILSCLGVVLICFITLTVQTNLAIRQQKSNSDGKLEVAAQRLVSNAGEAVALETQFDAFSQAKLDSIAYYYDGLNGDAELAPVIDTAEELENASANNSLAMGPGPVIAPATAGDVTLEEMAAQWGLTKLFLVDGSRGVLDSATAAADFDGAEFAPLWEGEAAVARGDERYYLSQLADGNYLVAARDATEFNAEESSLTSLAYSLHSIKVGSLGYVAAVNIADKTIAYSPNTEHLGKALADIGLADSILEDGFAGWVSFGDEQYYGESRLVEYQGEQIQLVAMRPRSGIQGNVNRLALMIALTFALILILIALYMHYIRTEQDKRFLNGEGEMEYLHLGGNLYFNQTIGAKTWHVLLVGLVVIFLSTFYLQTLSGLSTRSAHSAEKLTAIADILDENQVVLDETKEDYVTEYEGRTKNIAWLLSKDPTLVEEARLTELSKKAQVRYIYIFNAEGNIVSTNGIFSEYSINHDPESSSYVFWNVIKGANDVVIMDAEPNIYDPGTYIQYIATTRLDATGLVELGISPARLAAKIHAVGIPYTLGNIAVENNGFLLAVDKETGNLTYYSDANAIDSPAVNVGLTEDALSDEYSGYQTINGLKCFVSGMEYNDQYIYVAIPLTAITAGRLTLSVVVTVASLVLLLLLLAASLLGQPLKAEEKPVAHDASQPMEEPKGSFEIVTASGKVRRVDSVLSRWTLQGTPWEDCTAEQKLQKSLFWLCGVVAVVLMGYLLTHRGVYNRDSIISYIVNRRWAKEPSIFSLSYIALVVVEVMVVTTIIRKILSMAVANMGARAETIGRLMNSFIKYLSVIGTLFYCMSFIGVDSGTILASAGLLTLIVGLGAQSMVSDILAGIFIVFEGEFRVGDIVTLDTWRGTVREIGIRSTKIEDAAQNIKVINNSHISGVVNMTKKYSYAAVDVGIEYDESLERVEAVLEKELPLVKDRLPAIIAGPFYRGVSELGESSVNIKIIAQCAEAKRVQLTRDLNREMKLIFDRNDIGIPFPQIVLNQPTVHQKATRTEKRNAEKFVEEQKELTQDLAEETAN